MRYRAVIAWMLGLVKFVHGDEARLFPSQIQQPSSLIHRVQTIQSRSTNRARFESQFGLKIDWPPNRSSALLFVLAGNGSSTLAQFGYEPFAQPPNDSDSRGIEDSLLSLDTDDSNPTVLSKSPVPLDGAPRDEETDSPEKTQQLASSRDSFAWIVGSHNQLGILELDFQPLSRVWFRAPDPEEKRSDSSGIDATFGAKWLQGPDTPDLPPYLFNVLVNVFTKKHISERLSIDAMISPGWFTDFSNKGIESFRLPWHLVTYHDWDDNWQSVLGVSDLARDDIRYLPVVGMVFAPRDGDVRLDLVFPKPRIARRIVQYDKFDRWVYLSGELGGGSWAISRANRNYDVVTYRDYRLVAGTELVGAKGSATRIEIGWVFNRALEYRSNQGNCTLPDSLMIRMSADY